MGTRLYGLSTVLAFISFALVACGGDDDDSPEATASETEATANGGAATTAAATTDASETQTQATDSGGSAGEAGFVEVDGQSFAITDVRRCEPFSGREDDLDLQALGDGIQAFVVINRPIGGSQAVMHEFSMQGANAGGVFAGSATTFDGETWLDYQDNPLDAAPFEVSGDTVLGTIDTRAATDDSAGPTVSFEVAIPEDFVC
jgi:hypothetical protein